MKLSQIINHAQLVRRKRLSSDGHDMKFYPDQLKTVPESDAKKFCFVLIL